jgi:hypothetical protein
MAKRSSIVKHFSSSHGFKGEGWTCVEQTNHYDEKRMVDNDISLEQAAADQSHNVRIFSGNGVVN